MHPLHSASLSTASHNSFYATRDPYMYLSTCRKYGDLWEFLFVQHLISHLSLSCSYNDAKRKKLNEKQPFYDADAGKTGSSRAYLVTAAFAFASHASLSLRYSSAMRSSSGSSGWGSTSKLRRASRTDTIFVLGFQFSALRMARQTLPRESFVMFGW